MVEIRLAGTVRGIKKLVRTALIGAPEPGLRRPSHRLVSLRWDARANILIPFARPATETGGGAGPDDCWSQLGRTPMETLWAAWAWVLRAPCSSRAVLARAGSARKTSKRVSETERHTSLGRVQWRPGRARARALQAPLVPGEPVQLVCACGAGARTGSARGDRALPAE